MPRTSASQRMLDSLMAEEASESSDSSYDSPAEEPDAADSPINRGASAPVASSPPPLLAAQWLEADGDPARRSESFESEEGRNILPTPEHTAKRRNVCFGANATFEAGVTPHKVRKPARTCVRAPKPESLISSGAARW